MSTLDEQAAALPTEDAHTLKLLEKLGQSHLYTDWPAAGEATTDKQRLLAQVRGLDGAYPGGLSQYLQNARALLASARNGDNPFEGFTPRVPEGVRLPLGSEALAEAEARGMREVGHCGFVLVAGGLGERLGFQGIKLALPAETATGRCYLQLYIRHILALQERSSRLLGEQCTLPLAIMTSDDTHAATEALLRDNDHFGMPAGQITLMKQEKVASLLDDQPRIAPRLDDPYALQTKPHGHGDVHVLLHQTGIAERWLEQGIRWLLFFQDTNALAVHAIPPALGVSAQQELEVNTLCVPRKPGEAVGGIARLESGDRVLTINVEYNQLDPLLRATVDEAGDVADETGYSPYPGNTNVLAFALGPYVENLQRTGGGVPEFVNPKYTDAERTAFKSPTRLECMMQDYPKLLSSRARVGFTQFDRAFCFSAVKNALEVANKRQSNGLPPEGAASGEADLYSLQRRFLSGCGADIAAGQASTPLFPIVVLDPALITPTDRLRGQCKGLRISGRSVLVVQAEDVDFEDVEADGALVINAPRGAKVVLKGLRVSNRGWSARPLAEGESVPQTLTIRGYTLEKHETRTLTFEEPGVHVVEG